MNTLEDEYFSYLRDKYKYHNTHIVFLTKDKELLVNLNSSTSILTMAKTILWNDPSLMPPDDSMLKWATELGFSTEVAETRKELLGNLGDQIMKMQRSK